MGHKSFRVTWLHVFYHSVSGITIALLLWYSGLLAGIEGKTYDLRASLFSKKTATTDSIILVLVDQEAINWVADSNNYGIVWPWPRQLFAAIITNCLRRDAEAVGLDVMFTENSSFSVSDDLILRNSFLQVANVALGSVFPSNKFGHSTRWLEDIPKPYFSVHFSENAQSVIPTYSKATFPVPQVAAEGVILANVQHQPDKDGIFRKIHPLVQFDSNLLPNLGLAVYLAAYPETAISIQKDKLEIGGKSLPLDKDGKVTLKFRGPARTFTSMSAVSFLRYEGQLENGEITPDEIPDDLTGKYVFFGFTAPGLFDHTATPTDAVFSGVEINATMLDNFLSGDFIIPANQLMTILSVILMTVLSAFLLSYFSAQSTQVGLAFVLVPLPAGVAILLYNSGMDFKMIPVEIAVFTVVSASIAHRYFAVGKQEKFIRHSFKHYLSPVVIDQLMMNPDRLKLGGERKELTLFFSDLEGFTSISEGLDPENLTHLLNEYLTAMTDIILEEEGTVDKFEGDAIIAFWNAPLDILHHEEKGVRAALRCQQKLAQLRPYFMKKYHKELFMRIGINTGYAVAGNMGSSNRFDYTVLGDAVNLAARLEGANKHFKTYSMISEKTKNNLGSDFYCRELARLRVVGRSEPVTVYEPISYEAQHLDKSMYKPFEKGLNYFYDGNFKKALFCFQETADVDPVANNFRHKCQQMLDSSGHTEWNGVLNLDAK